MKRSLFVLGLLRDTDVEWLASVATPRRYAAGETLIDQGVNADSIFIIIEGLAQVEVSGTTIARVSAGDLVGEISLFDRRPPSATLRAEGALKALSIDLATLDRRLTADAEFASRLYFSLGALLAQRMRQAIGSDPADDDALDEPILEQLSLAGERFAVLTERALDGQ